VSEVDALQLCLHAEHAACYGYGVLGGVLAGADSRGTDDQLATAAYIEHRARRDELSDLVDGLGAEPAAAEPAYATPFAVRTTESCRRLARVLEDRCASVYAYALSQTKGDTRRFLLDALTGCAERTVAWGGEPIAFPGVDPADL
jgi:hypothetical protein